MVVFIVVNRLNFSFNQIRYKLDRMFSGARLKDNFSFRVIPA